MSNIVLAPSGAMSAHHQSQKHAPEGLRGFQPLASRRLSNGGAVAPASSSSVAAAAQRRNPILKSPSDIAAAAAANRSSNGGGSDDGSDGDDGDEDGSSSPGSLLKLRALQRELRGDEERQRALAAQDDAIVEKRLDVARERQERVRAAITGERVAVASSSGDENVLRVGDDGGDDGAATGAMAQAPPAPPPTVPALRENAYAAAAQMRIERAAARKLAKQEEVAAATAREHAERKRRGALANLALRMQQHPERFAELTKKPASVAFAGLAGAEQGDSAAAAGEVVAVIDDVAESGAVLSGATLADE